jgi:hypothetical protein
MILSKSQKFRMPTCKNNNNCGGGGSAAKDVVFCFLFVFCLCFIYGGPSASAMLKQRGPFEDDFAENALLVNVALPAAHDDAPYAERTLELAQTGPADNASTITPRAEDQLHEAQPPLARISRVDHPLLVRAMPHRACTARTLHDGAKYFRNVGGGFVKISQNPKIMIFYLGRGRGRRGRRGRGDGRGVGMAGGLRIGRGGGAASKTCLTYGAVCVCCDCGRLFSLRMFSLLMASTFEFLHFRIL